MIDQALDAAKRFRAGEQLGALHEAARGRQAGDECSFGSGEVVRNEPIAARFDDLEVDANGSGCRGPG